MHVQYVSPVNAENDLVNDPVKKEYAALFKTKLSMLLIISLPKKQDTFLQQ